MSHRTYHLVHANIAITRMPLDHPMMGDFIAQVDEINSIAQAAPGFVAQPTLRDEGEIFAGRMLLNASIWRSVEDLNRFTHQGKHEHALARRAEWFDQSEAMNYVLFWVPAGQALSEMEVKQRVEHLRANGPTPYAFTFNRSFTVDEMLSYGPKETK